MMREPEGLIHGLWAEEGTMDRMTGFPLNSDIGTLTPM